MVAGGWAPPVEKDEVRGGIEAGDWKGCWLGAGEAVVDDEGAVMAACSFLEERLERNIWPVEGNGGAVFQASPAAGTCGLSPGRRHAAVSFRRQLLVHRG